MRPRLLDLFCKAGGAAVGYHRAGFHVVGVDHRPQPHYPYEFIHADALTVPLEGFDAYHASPPCQGYSSWVKSTDSRFVSYSRGRNEPRLITSVRDRLLLTCKPYVIENVIGAAAAFDEFPPVTLCGSMFDLPIARHRLFESNFLLLSPHHPKCSGRAAEFARERGLNFRDVIVAGKSRRSGSLDVWREVMGIDWPMNGPELCEAIPPSFTEYLGRQMLAHLVPSAKGARL